MGFCREEGKKARCLNRNLGEPTYNCDLKNSLIFHAFFKLQCYLLILTGSLHIILPCVQACSQTEMLPVPVFSHSRAGMYHHHMRPEYKSLEVSSPTPDGQTWTKTGKNAQLIRPKSRYSSGNRQLITKDFHII